MKIKDRVETSNMKFKNRVIMPPMATAKADEKGHITEEILNYYQAKTKDKLFAAVIVEHSYVDERGKAHARQCSVADDSAVAGMSKLAQVIRGNEALAIAQISHAGSAAKQEVIGCCPVGPSAVVNPVAENLSMPQALTTEEIDEIKTKFIAAAERVKKAGFDGVELHSAHGYLLDQFLSPLTNKRSDAYGGDIYGRIRLHLEIIAGIKAKLGEDYSVLLRIGAGDFMEGGLTAEDAVIAAKEFAKAGVEVIDVSGGMCFFAIKDTRPGYFDVIAKPVFDAVDIPVILTGGVKKGKDIEDILSRRVCDLVGVGRAVYKDSDWMKNEVKALL